MKKCNGYNIDIIETKRKIKPILINMIVDIQVKSEDDEKFDLDF